MIRKAAIAVAVLAAIATAALVPPPRAAPALSFATTAEPAQSRSACRLPGCRPKRGSRKRPKARDGLHRLHQRRSRRQGDVVLRPIDLNRAGVAALARIPGVGVYLAERIVAYRGLVGPFASLDDLSDLDGISETRLASLGRYVVVR